MKRWKRTVALAPGIGRTALFFYRAKNAASYYKLPARNLVRWLFNSKEIANHTYNLEADNKAYLASLIAHILNVDYSTVARYFDEVESDDALKHHIIDATAESPLAGVTDSDVRMGRRLGWYALARAMKPKVIVETGVDRGLGSCILTAALMRNSDEGFEGRYYGLDINPEAGYLLSGRYADFGEIIYGDSIGTLSNLKFEIDLFINDSDHSADYEAREYETIVDKLSDNAVILGDNSHCTDKLFTFSLENNRQFVYFGEKPADHWYPGAGIGISFPSGLRAVDS